MSDAISETEQVQKGKPVSADDAVEGTVVDGHVYRIDPTSEQFTKLLMQCFAAGKAKALAEADFGLQPEAAPEPGNRPRDLPEDPGLAESLRQLSIEVAEVKEIVQSTSRRDKLGFRSRHRQTSRKRAKPVLKNV